MAGNLGSSPIQPLDVGNVVSAGMRLYRAHLKDYYLLALKAYVWLFVPVYGWAKFYALTSLISRLAFGDLVNQPESISSGQRFVNSRLWQFLLAMLLLFLIGIGMVIGVIIVFGILGLIAALIVNGTGSQNNPAIYIFLGLIAFVIAIVAIVAVLWLSTRFYLVNLPLAVEDNVDGATAISRSWELSQGNVWRILLISFVSVLVTTPVQIVVQILTTILQIIFTPLIQDGSTVFSLIYFALIMAVSFGSGALIVPFIHTTKAVIYYDLRSRREGLGLKLRDREI
ncbi:DUF975 domain-containing protein [Nostoc sp. CENA543]|uniref:glycerophosphoryl diester phosphodiesterase membrane domain-containing protein n=1 Tax=Nostoc sp. CENA543 TaxID=1869241 RepID=UPI000CA1FD58|nr:glycerophosphoryl diester phosphodiesterase membrane domain-containing protein [Nostoc sp. CENA543]AUT00743.1 DUF975 domain-containing protein [Nostoc sp. CENA543]